jgi:hypothetical protein
MTSVQLATPTTRVPTVPARDAAARADRQPRPGPSRIWTVLDALAYAGAYIDPTRVLAAHRFAEPE